MSFGSAASCGLVVALMSGVLPGQLLAATEKAATAEPDRPAVRVEQPQVIVEMQFIQIDDPIAGVSLRGVASVELDGAGEPPQVEDDSIEITTAEGESPTSGDGEAQPQVVDLAQAGGVADGLGLGVHRVSRETVLLVRGRALRFERGSIVEGKATAEKPPAKDKGYKVFSSPRLRVLVGQAAEMTVGSAVPFMVQNQDGCLEMKHTDGADEGISVRLRVEKADERLVTFDEVRMRLSMVTGRQPIEGVPFEVGRPIIRAMEVSSALSLSPDHSALIAFPRVGKDSPLILATISTRLSETP